MLDKLKTRLIMVALLALVLLTATAGGPHPDVYKCNSRRTEICDNFSGRTRFFEDFSRRQWNHMHNVLWHRTDDSDDYEDAYFYQNKEGGPTKFLRVGINSKATDQHANFAEIGLVEINNYLADFPIPVDSRVEFRMRYAADMKADNTAPDQGVGSAGMLFWDYHMGEIDYDNYILPPPNDAFGFVWQQPESTPNPGFWISNVAGGYPGGYIYYPNIDLSEWHVYAIERRHESMTYFIDGEEVYVQALNQEGTIQLSDDQKLTADFWRDNMRYTFDPSTYSISISFQDIQHKSYVDIDYFQVTNLH